VLQAGRPGHDSWQEQDFLFSFTASRPALGLSQPPIQWVPETISPGVKRPGREADHSPSSAEARMLELYHLLPNTY
jgi:hypothetical protein